MPVSYTDDASCEIIRGAMIGNVTIEELKETFYEIVSSPGFAADTDTIWDLRELDFTRVDLAAQRELYEFRKQIDADRGRCKVALVVPDKVEMMIARLFAEIGHDLSHDLEMFLDEKSAEQWILQGRRRAV